jgi:hypothetical protein
VTCLDTCGSMSVASTNSPVCAESSRAESLQHISPTSFTIARSKLAPQVASNLVLGPGRSCRPPCCVSSKPHDSNKPAKPSAMLPGCGLHCCSLRSPPDACYQVGQSLVNHPHNGNTSQAMTQGMLPQHPSQDRSH